MLRSSSILLGRNGPSAQWPTASEAPSLSDPLASPLCDELPRSNYPGPSSKRSGTGLGAPLDEIFGRHSTAVTAVMLGAVALPGVAYATVTPTPIVPEEPVDPISLCDPAFGSTNTITKLDISTLPENVRPTATWLDRALGNGDGRVSSRELVGYANGSSQPQAPMTRLLRAFSNAVASLTSTVLGTSHSQSEGLPRELTRAGGTGDASDVELLVAEVSRIPAPILERAKAAGIKFVAVRDSVLDHLTHLGSQPPRGWPADTNWSAIPGVYNPAGREVVIATRDDGQGVRCVPPMLTGHGSDNLVLHEFAHGLDYRRAFEGVHSNAEAFRAAYASDLARLSEAGEGYLLQNGVAGREEAFAESFSRYFSRDPDLAVKMPALFAYWQRFEARLGS